MLVALVNALLMAGWVGSVAWSGVDANLLRSALMKQGATRKEINYDKARALIITVPAIYSEW